MSTLDDRLSLLYDVHRVSHLTHELVEDALEDQQLNGTEFALYSYLATRGAQTVSEVAAGIAATLPATSKLLAGAEERGHLVRSDNPADGRSTLVELSEAGRTAHRAARPAFLRALGSVQDGVGPAMTDIRWALSRLDHALSAALDRPALTDGADRRDRRTLDYDGPGLTASEEDDVRRYIDWLRWRRDA